jgi:hypothetical protein
MNILAMTQMLRRELPRSNYKLYNEALTGVLINMLGIAPLAFVSSPVTGQHAATREIDVCLRGASKN